MADTTEKKISKEIDIIGSIRKVLKEWKLVSYFVLAFAVVGIVAAFSTKKQFTTTVILAPEANSAGGGLSSAAELFDLSLGAGNGSGDAIFPELYPNIFTSSTFLISLFDTPVPVFGTDTTTTFYKHVKRVYRPPFWKYPKIWLAIIIKKLTDDKKKNPNAGNGIDPFWLTEEQYNICNLMRSNINCIVDQKTGLITITVTDYDELIAATMADTITKRLSDYITDYRTKKARHDLAFIEKMYLQTKKEYIEAQENYAKVADANLNLIQSRSKVKVEHLRNEMSLKYTMYSNISSQLQLTKQRVQERTPVFTVIQPATVALEASSMSRMMQIAMFAFLGFVAGSLWCLYGRDLYRRYKRYRKKKVQ